MRSVSERFRKLLDESRASLKEAEAVRKRKLEELEGERRRKLDRYLAAKKLSTDAETAVHELDALRATLTDDMIKLIRKAGEDTNSLILQPSFSGIGDRRR